MWNRFLIWLGVREVPPDTIEVRHAKATAKAEGALSQFRYAVDSLESAAAKLKAVSAEAEDIARVNAERAQAALTEASDNLAVADKIKALIS